MRNTKIPKSGRQNQFHPHKSEQNLKDLKCLHTRSVQKSYKKWLECFEN